MGFVSSRGGKRHCINTNTLETSGEDVDPIIETSGEDAEPTLETSGEDVETTLETSGEDVSSFQNT